MTNHTTPHHNCYFYVSCGQACGRRSGQPPPQCGGLQCVGSTVAAHAACEWCTPQLATLGTPHTPQFAASTTSPPGNERELLEEETLMRGMLENPRVRARFMKYLKEYEGASISQFRFARVTSGITQAGFNALRFAMHGWAPGTARMLKYMYAYLRH